MAARMLIDATHPEETRVVILKGNRIDEFDFESSTKKTIKGNIYLAKVTRVEPSLQAAFVEYGGNRHGFLAFSEIHPDYYQIPVADRQALLDAQAAEDAAAEAEEEAADAAEEAGDQRPLEGGDTDAEPVAEGSDSLRTTEAEDDNEQPGENPEPDTDTATDRPPQTLAEDTGLEGPVMAGPLDGETAPESAPAEPPPDGEAQPASADEVPRTEAEVATVGGDVLDEVRQPRRRVPVRHYKIQEVIKRRQILLVQVVKEERGNKGAALTTFLSLAGRYCVVMPNTARGGGISRKIVSAADRKRLKSIAQELDPPEGMGVIVRTAGMERSRAEIKRDYDFLLRTWDQIRDTTLQSTAPALVYEEGTLIKRAIRDLYQKDIEEVWVEGEEGYRQAKDLMKVLMPSHAKRVQPYRDTVPLFHRFQVETQLDAMYTPVVQLRSGGYIVINTTEALVAIDVNSGRATREHNIEETAYKTNMEAAEEVARQLRLRDLAGLIVIDFIDMENHRNTRNVERKLKECLKGDRARIQVGRISAFGLMEMSRQRLRPSLVETSTQVCPHCNGLGHVRSTESTALYVLRAVEDEGIRDRTDELVLSVANPVAVYLFNHKRQQIASIESRYRMKISISVDDSLVPPNHRIDRIKTRTADPARLEALKEWRATPVEEDGPSEEDEEIETIERDNGSADEPFAAGRDDLEDDDRDGGSEREAQSEGRESEGEGESKDGRRRRRRPRRRRRGERPEGAVPQGDRPAAAAEPARQTPANALDYYSDDENEDAGNAGGREAGDGTAPETEGTGERESRAAEPAGEDGRPRRRGRRGGRRRHRDERDPPAHRPAPADPAEVEQPTVSIWPGVSTSAPEPVAPAPVEDLYVPPTPIPVPMTEPVQAMPVPALAEPEEAPATPVLLPGQTDPGKAEIVITTNADEPVAEKKARFGWWRKK